MSHSKIVVINGFPKSGKDTFCDICREICAGSKTFVYSYSTIDIIKEIAKNSYGWNGEKTPEARKLLSDLKQIMTKKGDIPFNDICRKISVAQMGMRSTNMNQVIFIHCREPEEIEKFVKKYNAITVFIDRAHHELELSNSSDMDVLNYHYDYVIDNNGTLTELKDAAATFLTDILKK